MNTQLLRLLRAVRAGDTDAMMVFTDAVEQLGYTRERLDRAVKPYISRADACAGVALETDFDPVPWASAPEWRKSVAHAVARAALNTTSPDVVRAAWFTEMTRMGWKWGREIDEDAKTHPGIVMGELTRGGALHWENVITRVRQMGRTVNARMTGP